MHNIRIDTLSCAVHVQDEAPLYQTMVATLPEQLSIQGLYLLHDFVSDSDGEVQGCEL